jgi:hypothetical protein
MDIPYMFDMHQTCSTFCINKPTWNCKPLPYRDQRAMLKLIPDRPLQPIINAEHIYISNNFRQLFLKLYEHAYKENLI